MLTTFQPFATYLFIFFFALGVALLETNNKYREGVKSSIDCSIYSRVAELGSLSSGAKMAMKIFVKGVFTIFATNASFLRVIANLQN